MRNSRIIISFLLLILASYCKAQDIFIPKFTAINPVAYTDVVYTGIKDTVLIATYSGRISKIINGDFKENVIAKVNDEVYALAYYPASKEIAVATLENGILLLDERNGKVKTRLPLLSSWAVYIGYSDNYKYLFTYDQNGHTYIWDVRSGYKELPLSGSFPKGRIIKINGDDIAIILGQNKIVFWDIKLQKMQKEWAVELDKFADMDGQYNFLSINFNQCSCYNAYTRKTAFKLMHPNWPLPNTENEKQVYDIPYHMEITAAKFAQNKIYTGSIDRTVRVWDKTTGKLLSTLTGNKGSISKIKVSGDQKQVVSIDLKGIIKFWQVQ